MNQRWWYWLGLAGLLGLMGAANAGEEQLQSLCSFAQEESESKSIAALSEADSAALVDISGDVVVSGTSIPVCALVLANGKNQFSCDGQGHYALDDVWLDSAGQITLYAWAEGFSPYKIVFTPSSSSVNQRVAMTVPQPCCPNTYTLTVNSSGASGVGITSGTGHGGTTNYTKTGICSGTSVSLTAPANASGKNFSSWSGCTSTSGTNCTVSMTANKTVTAYYDTGGDARWGVINGLCFSNGNSVTFSATTGGVTKTSITHGCTADPTWEGYAVTTPGTKTFSANLQPGGLTSTFSRGLPRDTCTLILAHLVDGQPSVSHGQVDCNTPLP